MTKYPEEQRAELLSAFAKEVGPQATIVFQQQGRSEKYRDEKPFDAWINPRGWAGVMRVVEAHGDTWDETYELLRSRWALRAAQERAATITDMALAVIDITSKMGECSDASLRARGFCTTDIDALGGEACIEARAKCEACGGVSFSIIRLGIPNVAVA